MQVQIDNDVFNQETWFAVEHEVLLFFFIVAQSLRPVTLLPLQLLFLFSTHSAVVLSRVTQFMRRTIAVTL